MTPPPSSARRQRTAALWWLGIAIVVGNGLYDVLMAKAAKEYLLRHAMHQAGLGPAVTIPQIMEPALFDAIWQSTLVAGGLLLAALLTIRYAPADS